MTSKQGIALFAPFEGALMGRGKRGSRIGTSPTSKFHLKIQRSEWERVVQPSFPPSPWSNVWRGRTWRQNGLNVIDRISLTSSRAPFEKPKSVRHAMLNGREDFLYPVESSQIPLFHLLGVSNAENRLVISESGHLPPWQTVAKESLNWLDHYLGPVVTAEVSH